MRSSNHWDALEVRHLRAFEAVARHRSFAAAADELGYTQSAVSQQLRALETIIGTSLFHRYPGGRRPVDLTDAGRLFLKHAQRLLTRVLATRADVDAMNRGDQGELVVGTIQSIGARILPTALVRLRLSRPDVEVTIRELTSVEQLVTAVESGTVDVAFAAVPIDDGPFELRALGPDPYVLVAGKDRPERRLSDLDGRRVFGIRGCRHDRLVEQLLLAQGLVPAAYDQFDDNGMIQELVAAGEGIAVVPQLTVDPSDPRVQIHPVAEIPPRELVAIVHSERRLGQAAREFVDIVTAVCTES